MASASQADLPSSPGLAVVLLVRRTIERFADNKVLTLLVYAGFVFTKMLAASGWRVSTALAVLNASSLPNVVAGATLSAIAPVSLVLLSVVTFWWIGGRWHGRWVATLYKSTGRRADRITHILARNRLFFLGVGGLAVVVFAIESWTLTLIVLAFALVVGVLDRFITQHMACTALFAVLVSFLTYAQIVSSVWLPHETVIYGPNRSTVVGYVVGTTDEQLTVLRSRTRLLTQVPLAQVHERYQCAVHEVGYGGLLPVAQSSLLLLIVHEPVPPSCPGG